MHPTEPFLCQQSPGLAAPCFIPTSTEAVGQTSQPGSKLEGKEGGRFLTQCFLTSDPFAPCPAILSPIFFSADIPKGGISCQGVAFFSNWTRLHSLGGLLSPQWGLTSHLGPLSASVSPCCSMPRCIGCITPSPEMRSSTAEDTGEILFAPHKGITRSGLKFSEVAMIGFSLFC